MSGVRGPTSALTEFLRERNIHVTNTNRYRRRDEGQFEVRGESTVEDAAETTGMAATESAHGVVAAEAGPSRITGSMKRNDGKKEALSSRRRGFAAGSSMRFDESDGEEDEDEEDEEDEEDPPNSTTQNNNNARNTLCVPGSINYCGRCTNKFTVTKYTEMAPEGALCHKCGSLYQAEKPRMLKAKSKESVKPKRRKVVSREIDARQIPSLQSLCINVVSNYIDDVEALGGVGRQNMEAISKSISKNRRLNPSTLHLFLEPTTRILSLYDCSKLDSDALQCIPKFSPNIEHINLQMCGQLDDAVIDAWIKKFKKLRRLELYGPYLVRVEAWHRFFESVGHQLESFKIRETPRFNKSCAQKLVECCPNVQELGLAQIGPLNNHLLKQIHAFNSLTYLDISDPGVSAPGVPPKSLADCDVIQLLHNVGSNLNHLNLSRNADLSDRTVLEGLLPYCNNLNSLLLGGCYNINGDALCILFHALAAKGAHSLVMVDLERCSAVEDTALMALLEHSGPTLRTLNLNSCRLLTSDALLQISIHCPRLESLDIGFCRQADDNVVMNLINGLRSTLKTVYVFGNNRVSAFAFSKEVRIIGRERTQIT